MVKRFFIACAALLFASYAQAQITEPFGTFVGGLSNAVAVSNSDALYVLQGGVSKRASPGVISGAAGTPTGSIMWNNSGLLSGFGNWNGTSTVAFGNGGVAQSLRVYNTVDSLATPANFESAIFDWQTTTNVLTIGTINSGTGVGRNFQFIAGGNIVGDFGVTAPGLWTLPMVVTALQFGPSGNQAGNHPPQIYFGAYTASGSIFPNIVINGHTVAQQVGIGLPSTTTPTDVLWIGAVNNIGQTWNLTQKLDLELPLGTFRAYNTTDATATNYERGVFGFQSNVLTIGTQAGGTGTARNFQFIQGGTPVGDYLVTRASLWNFSVNTGASGGSDQSYELAITNNRSTSGPQTGIALYNPNATNANDRSWAISTNYTLHGSLDFVRSSSNSSVPDGTFAYLTINPSANSGNGIIATYAQSLYMYNVLDNIGNPTNFERGIFDWQSNANVLTIGTQKGGTGSTRGISFIIGGTEAARIDTAGKFIFGGTSARDGSGNFVELVSGTGTTVGTGGTLGLAIIAFSAANNQGNLIFDFSGSDTVGTQVAATSGQTIGNIEFRGSDSTGFARSASISALADATFTSTSSPGRLSFATTPSGSETLAERMRIDNKGHVNYTTSAPTASACAGFALSTGSSDTAGRVTFTSATSCAISFANAFTNAPFCSVIPGSAASTVTITTSTTVLTATFGTAQTAMFYQCFGN